MGVARGNDLLFIFQLYFFTSKVGCIIWSTISKLFTIHILHLLLLLNYKLSTPFCLICILIDPYSKCSNNKALI